MPRHARLILPNFQHRVIQRGQLICGERFVGEVARKIGRRVRYRGQDRP